MLINVMFSTQSSYMDEKLKSLQVGFGRAKNIFELNSNPFISPENPVRGPTIISKLLYDIKQVIIIRPATKHLFSTLAC